MILLTILQFLFGADKNDAIFWTNYNLVTWSKSVVLLSGLIRLLEAATRPNSGHVVQIATTDRDKRTKNVSNINLLKFNVTEGRPDKLELVADKLIFTILVWSHMVACWWRWKRRLVYCYMYAASCVADPWDNSDLICHAYRFAGKILAA